MGETHKGEFWIEPDGGLGNRMQALASAHFFSQKYHKDLCILWSNNGALAADFDDIFEAVPEVRVVRITTDGYRAKPFLRLKSELIRKKVFSKCDFITGVDEWGLGERLRTERIFPLIDEKVRYAKNVYVKSWTIFVPLYEDSNITMDFLKPSRKVCQRGQELFDRIDADTIGVHIRRTDHEEAIAGSPTELFINRMQEEVKKNPKHRFFVATDDQKVEEELSLLFQQKVFFKNEKSWGRKHREGMLDACVDLWALSKCKKILGSKGSTFGMVAAKLGPNQLEIVTK